MNQRKRREKGINDLKGPLNTIGKSEKMTADEERERRSRKKKKKEGEKTSMGELI